VIGDGALTGGLAYEAINNAGSAQDELHRDPQRQRDVDRAERRLDRVVSGCCARSRCSPRAARCSKGVLDHVPLGDTARKALSTAEIAAMRFVAARSQGAGDLRGDGLPLHRTDRRPRPTTRSST
jgi:hypothetical protein